MPGGVPCGNQRECTFVTPPWRTEVIHSGSVDWVVEGGGTGDDIGRDIAMITHSDIYISGYFDSETATFGNTTLTRLGWWDMLLLKMDLETREVTWGIVGGGRGPDYAHAVVPRTPLPECIWPVPEGCGSLYVTGSFWDEATFGKYICDAARPTSTQLPTLPLAATAPPAPNPPPSLFDWVRHFLPHHPLCPPFAPRRSALLLRAHPISPIPALSRSPVTATPRLPPTPPPPPLVERDYRVTSHVQFTEGDAGALGSAFEDHFKTVMVKIALDVGASDIHTGHVAITSIVQVDPVPSGFLVDSVCFFGDKITAEKFAAEQLCCIATYFANDPFFLNYGAVTCTAADVLAGDDLQIEEDSTPTDDDGFIMVDDVVSVLIVLGGGLGFIGGVLILKTYIIERWKLPKKKAPVKIVPLLTPGDGSCEYSKAADGSVVMSPFTLEGKPMPAVRQEITSPTQMEKTVVRA
ncbi:hypothetical protein CYMTET_23148 [Cymbomonas tetramitiformis]|uniref:Uncharacterized protein n=1 Tax=Cymbomonas tetramitiformis TaxID=36881 RepID=A0AAE0FYU4_9CHLO|nr:hypothetical protein CYMTET_23148 [Cymbomonas tetramitiformis]